MHIRRLGNEAAFDEKCFAMKRHSNGVVADTPCCIFSSF